MRLFGVIRSAASVFTGFRRKSQLTEDQLTSLALALGGDQFALQFRSHSFWDLEKFWRATHFVAVFCEGNNNLTTQYNNFWDLEKFWRATHFVAVFCEGNYPSDTWQLLDDQF